MQDDALEAFQGILCALDALGWDYEIYVQFCRVLLPSFHSFQNYKQANNLYLFTQVRDSGSFTANVNLQLFPPD